MPSWCPVTATAPSPGRDDGAAARPEQRPTTYAVRPVHAQVHVRQTRLCDGRGVQQQARAEGLEPAQRTVVEDLGEERGAALEGVDRRSGQDCVVVEHRSFLPAGLFSLQSESP